MRIKPGFGYWRTTTHPIGGDFRRAARDGSDTFSVTLYEWEPMEWYKGCNAKGLTMDGEKIAFAIEHTMEESE